MQNATMKTASTDLRPNKSMLLAIILIVSVVAAFLAYRSIKTTPVLPAKTVISQRELQDKYGLRVNLIAVTAAGGMVDLRLKMLDGDKARLILQDNKNFPTLYVGDARVTLQASEDSQSGQIKFEDNNNLFLMFPNSGNIVKQGSTVSVMFGDRVLEPIVVK